MQDKLPTDQTQVPKPQTNPTTPTSIGAESVPKADTPPATPAPELPKIEVKVPPPEEFPTPTATEPSQEQWQQILQQFTSVFDASPSALGDFFNKYKQPLITVGLILLALLGVKLLAGFLDAINDIPLVEPTFQIIGLGYTGWFVYRYLLTANNRQELSQLINNIKEYVFGSNGKNS